MATAGGVAGDVAGASGAGALGPSAAPLDEVGASVGATASPPRPPSVMTRATTTPARSSDATSSSQNSGRCSRDGRTAGGTWVTACLSWDGMAQVGTGRSDWMLSPRLPATHRCASGCRLLIDLLRSARLRACTSRPEYDEGPRIAPGPFVAL